MAAFHALADIGSKKVVMQNTASALSALFVTLQILLLSPSPTAAISVDLAKKCRDMAIKAHPLAMPGKPYAQAERDFFRQCVAKNGQIEYTEDGGCADVDAAPNGNPQHGPCSTNPHPHL
jgi:hypothetical protein